MITCQEFKTSSISDFDDLMISHCQWLNWFVRLTSLTKLKLNSKLKFIDLITDSDDFVILYWVWLNSWSNSTKPQFKLADSCMFCVIIFNYFVTVLKVTRNILLPINDLRDSNFSQVRPETQRILSRLRKYWAYGLIRMKSHYHIGLPIIIIPFQTGFQIFWSVSGAVIAYLKSFTKGRVTSFQLEMYVVVVKDNFYTVSVIAPITFPRQEYWH